MTNSEKKIVVWKSKMALSLCQYFITSSYCINPESSFLLGSGWISRKISENVHFSCSLLPVVYNPGFEPEHLMLNWFSFSGH